MSIDSHKPILDWSLIEQHLQAGAYERAADLLFAAQAAGEQAADPIGVALMASLGHTCLACHQCQLEIAWHQQAMQVAEVREEQLRQCAQTLLNQLNRQTDAGFSNADAQIELPSINPVRRPMALLVHLWLFLYSLWQQSGLLLDTAPEAQTSLHTGPEDEVAYKLEEEPVSEEPASLVATPAELSAVETAARPTPPPEQQPVDEPTVPSLVVYCLGAFQVYQDDQLVEEWPSNKGQAIFKYLVTHRERPIAKEVLMELFWPEATPDAARNNLNVAIYGLRRALRQGHPEFSHVLFQNDAYLLNPELRIWVDVEEFNQHFRIGQRLEQAKELEQALREYRAAEALYQGEFLAEDRYEDWVLPRRQSLQDDYLTLLDRLSRYYLDHADYDACAVMCGKLLAIDSCREDAYRRLMRCYSRQGHYHLALRQYHLCVEALQHELEVEPDEATQALYRQIRQRRSV